MWTIEEFKRDTEKQILVACIVFFLVAFPYYFNAVSNGALGTSSGVTGLYEVGGDTRLVELDSGMEYVASGETWTIDDLSTDSVDGASDMNIVGVLVTLSYGEDETNPSRPQCAGPLGGQPAADTISGTVIHGPHNASASGNNADSPASHTYESIWYNDSMVGEVVLSSISEIEEQIDSNGAGLGAYSLDITVDAEAGNAAGGGPNPCDREDNGEEVSYKVELIVYDYVIVPFLELDDIE